MVHNVAKWEDGKPQGQVEVEEAVAWTTRIEAMHTRGAAEARKQLAQRMLICAQAIGVGTPWVTTDEVYDRDPPLRRWLEERP